LTLLGRARAGLRVRTRAREVRNLVRRRALDRRSAGRALLRAFADRYPTAVFVEIGSNDGEQHDHLRPHILGLSWSGVMVEPVPYVFERLVRNYGHLERVRLENAAVGETDGHRDFFYLQDASQAERRSMPSWYDGVGSFSRESVLSHARHIADIEERIVCRQVPTITFESLCARHHLDRIDLLVIDTEGYDWEIIRRIDLEARRPRLLVYEHYHLSPDNRRSCLSLLHEHGYETMEEGFDTFCLDTREPDRLTERWSQLQPVVSGVSLHDEPAPQPHPDLIRLTPEDHRYLTSLYDDTSPLPPGAAAELEPTNPVLADLRERYAALDLPVLDASRWRRDAIEGFLDLRYFRGETLITWHYRELPRISELKFFVFASYVRERDELGLLERLGEDGAFGCWTFSYSGYGRYSRDLLESVNEICFLERQLQLSRRPNLRILDIGAGYGRLAHRMSDALPDLADYCCVDAIPESTFLSGYYLEHRGVCPPSRVVALDRIGAELHPGSFDLAVNVHAFPECTYEAIRWWLELLAQLEVPQLLIVPNESDALLSLEADGTRRDFAPLVEAAGYALSTREPVIDDPAVRELLALDDSFFLFERSSQ